MEYTKLGSSGLTVSRICLGCMSYGDPASGDGQHPWSLDETASQPFFRQALDAGITFFDTANMYSEGTSEEIVGRTLLSMVPRDRVVIATKVFARMGPGPNGSGLSRGAIMTQVDASLRRLGTDYIDLYQIHRVDPETPWEETLEALHDLVKAGKVRYLGASSMWAWQFAKALHLADLHGWTRFVSMQDQYNLLYREEEREMLPLCRDQGIGVVPWSPLARGRLTRSADEVTDRSRADDIARKWYQGESGRQIIDAVATIAEQRGVPRAQVALAWLLSRPGLTAPIVGATKPNHLDDAVAALDVRLSEDEITALEKPYVSQPTVGYA
ncbi:aldo/keto reductase [Amycolatopsis sp. lyj-109]|uniref:aldo/keto reductase n=1 Tax=Amycolatopsis sp. lyj-109 TaxID=2789287 RepID=UPI003979460C